MYEFKYHRPTTVRQAANLLAKHSEAKLLAGGHSLIPVMKLRLAKPSDLVDLSQIEGLNTIELKGRSIVIGAMAKHGEVANSKVVQEALPVLAEVPGSIGDPAVRHRGTCGGSIANSDPAADYPSSVLALNATIITNKRKIAADDFFKGLFETALEPGEIITAVSFPIPERSAYMKFPNPASRYAIVGVFVAKTGNNVRVGVTGAGACAFRQKDMEAALSKNFSADAIKDIKQSDNGLNSDIHASAEYRAHLVNVMARRAVQACG